MNDEEEEISSPDEEDKGNENDYLEKWEVYQSERSLIDMKLQDWTKRFEKQFKVDNFTEQELIAMLDDLWSPCTEHTLLSRLLFNNCKEEFNNNDDRDEEQQLEDYILKKSNDTSLRSQGFQNESESEEDEEEDEDGHRFYIRKIKYDQKTGKRLAL